MRLELQFQIKNNPLYKQYLREHSEWYKILNRNPNRFAEFEEKVKETYQLRPTDKLHRVLDNIEMIETLLSSLKM